MDPRNVTFMFYGFAAVWAILFAYLIFLVLRERHLKDELDRVKRMIEDREHKS
jgi:CcmD family protein